ncbi:protein SHORTAGE IN CHIASMATA 1 isoform X2 [Impatiens glandulifera]|uniref:protein SHORTAGE IN CHIASMATA 1 isoform X2 n=1 Tax=Impatiens glandulifera TaxID=253017 RepID=UPI001FB051FD|nr:protein SHORTAGE IN CHIASMATA 1 isoform X2 [Impatiens glandulifera]
MRTRFHVIDCFNPAPLCVLANLEFLLLPLPQLPPSPSPFSTVEDLHCFDHASYLHAPLEIETFQIEHSLSKLLSDILPCDIDAGVADIVDARPSSEDAGASQIWTSEEDNVPFFGCMDRDGLLLFEVPEQDLCLQTDCFPGEDRLELFLAHVNPENDKGMLLPVIQCPSKIQESVYMVDEIIPDCDFEQKASPPECTDSYKNQIHMFPFFEVDDISLGLFGNIPVMKDTFLLEDIEPEPCPQTGGVPVSCNELLSSVDIDITKHVFNQGFTDQDLGVDLSFLSFSSESDLISIIEYSMINQRYSFPNGKVDDSFVFPSIQLTFETIQFLDNDISHSFDVFLNFQGVCEQGYEHMLAKATDSMNFNDLIVGPQLTLEDGLFKSLPIPTFNDETVKSMDVILEEILEALKLEPHSASNEIYLDWHLLEEGYKNSYSFSFCWEKMLVIDDYSSYSVTEFVNDGKMVIDIISLGDNSKGLKTKENKESLTLNTGCLSNESVFSGNIAASRLKGESQKPTGLSDTSAVQPSLSKARHQIHDLNFLLNHQESSEKICQPAETLSSKKTTFPLGSSFDPTDPFPTVELKLQKWDFKLHEVKLSDNFLKVLNDCQESYLALLKSDKYSAREQKLPPEPDIIELLRLPKEKLTSCISSNVYDDKDMVFIAICAIKQLGWYLCYFGIHAAFHYIDKLCGSVDILKCKLSSLYKLIADMHKIADSDIIESHPSLRTIQEILLSSGRQATKFLLVSDQVFWWPLKKLLSSLQILYSDQQIINENTGLHGMSYICNDADIMQGSDCYLVSSENISASFPFEKFHIILEYGGSRSSSRISSISQKLSAYPVLHFIKVELEDTCVQKAPCRGPEMPQKIDFRMDVDPPRLNLGDSLQKLEHIVNFVPDEMKCDGGSTRDGMESFNGSLRAPPEPMEKNHRLMNTTSFLGKVIIVNTQNLEKEMLISRRNTYQRILTMEKEGFQVVERDLKLPVDIIISPATCFVWYNCRNIQTEACASGSAASCLPLCIDNIAANVLTSLSFAFTGCIMVFEGESDFLSAAMESSDKLYAAAASLRIVLQIFYSYTSESTNQFILNCISCSTHAILSSGDPLAQFLQYSHDRRVLATHKYHVPDESMGLLSTLCRYGERDDSKSGMTDCSSSVSSAPDLENYCCRGDSEKKKQSRDKLRRLESETQYPDHSLSYIKEPRRYKDTGTLADANSLFQTLNFSVPNVEKISGEEMGFVEGLKFNNSRGYRSLDLMDNKLFTLEEGIDKYSCHEKDSMYNSVNLGQDIRGEIVNIKKNKVLESTISFSIPKLDFDHVEADSETSRKSSCSNFLLPFSTTADINPDFCMWDPGNDLDHMMKEFDQHTNANAIKYNFPMKQHEKTLHGSMPKDENFHMQSVQEKDISSYRTPLSMAIHSNQQQQGSPWTIEFLNRVREKSRLHRQTVPCDKSPLYFGRPDNISRGKKRKSPSILDFYKYQGGTSNRKTIEPKKQKGSLQPSILSSNEKKSGFPNPAWTPLDKKARQTLSFSTGGGRGQAKLIWSDSEKEADTTNRRFNHSIN